MSGHTRQWVTVGASRKRKERDGSDDPRGPITTKAEPAPGPASPTPAAPATNRLLAGYLAHEFLTHGTLLGQLSEPARSESADTIRSPGPAGPDPGRAYADVARLLKADGAHIPGIVNPTQLGRWLRM